MGSRSGLKSSEKLTRSIGRSIIFHRHGRLDISRLEIIRSAQPGLLGIDVHNIT